MKPILRDVITPAAGGLFLVIGVSGIALFFHWSPGLFHTAHEWLGLPFAAIALWHAARHWRSLASYATRPMALSAIALVLAGAVVLMAETASSRQGNPQAIFQALGRAPLGTVATVLGVPSQQAALTLTANGINAHENQTVEEIARAAGVSTVDVLTRLARSEP